MFIIRLLKKIVISETILNEKELLKKKHAIIVQKFKLAHENRQPELHSNDFNNKNDDNKSSKKYLENKM